VQVAAHDRVVVEDPARAVLSGKDAALVREVYACGVDEVDDRHPAAHRDLLRAQHLGDRLRPPGARLHRRIVSDDDDRPILYGDDSGDDARGGRLTVVTVVGDEESDLEEVRAGIAQEVDPLTRGELALRMLARDPLGTAPLTQALLELLQLPRQRRQPPGPGRLHACTHDAPAAPASCREK